MKLVSFDTVYKIPSIAVSDEHILHDLLRFTSFFNPKVVEFDKNVSVNYIALYYEKQYLFFENKICTFTGYCIDDFLCFIREFFEQNAIVAHPGAQIFHGAAVSKDGVCICLVAPSGYGKSTLAFNLCQQGWDLVSDDLLMFYNGTIVPFPLPLEIRPGIQVEKSFEKYLLTKDCNGKMVFAIPSTTQIIESVYFVELRREQHCPILSRLTFGEAYISLLNNLKVPCEKYETIRKVITLAKSHMIYSLSNVRINESTEAIINLLNGHKEEIFTELEIK